MAQNARIKLTSTSLLKLGGVCDEIMGIGKKTGVKVRGPTPLPVKRLNVVTRKSPCGSGTETYENGKCECIEESLILMRMIKQYDN